MNLIENYLEPDYNVKVLPPEKAPTQDTTWVAFDGEVDCYGNVHQVHKLFPLDKWKKVKKQGYYLA